MHYKENIKFIFFPDETFMWQLEEGKKAIASRVTPYDSYKNTNMVYKTLIYQ